MRALLWMTLLAMSCAPMTTGGTGGGSAGAGGGSGGGSGDVGTCAQLPVACGELGAGGGGAAVSCGECFFDRTVLGQAAVTNSAAMVATSDGLVIAWQEQSSPYPEFVLSRELPDGGFSREAFAPPGEWSSPGLGLAVAADGTTFVAYPEDSLREVWLATSVAGGLPDGGHFMNESVDDGELPTLALDHAGAVHFAYVKPQNLQPAVWVAQRASDGGWERSVVEQIDATGTGLVGQPVVLFDAAGAEHVVYRVLGNGPEGGLHHVSGGVVTVLPATGPGRTPIAAAFDAQDRLHVLWSLDGLGVSHSMLSATGWSEVGVWSYGAHELGAMTIAPGGLPALAFHSRSSVELFSWNGFAHGRQSIQSCDEGPLAMVFDTAGRLRIASGCSAMSVLTPRGYYPADHASRCADLTTRLCGLACGACAASDGDCAISTSTGGSSSANYCPENFGGRACWNADRSDAMLEACRAVADALTCTTPATDGVDLQSGPCHDLFVEP